MIQWQIGVRENSANSSQQPYSHHFLPMLRTTHLYLVLFMHSLPLFLEVGSLWASWISPNRCFTKIKLLTRFLADILEYFNFVSSPRSNANCICQLLLCIRLFITLCQGITSDTCHTWQVNDAECTDTDIQERHAEEQLAVGYTCLQTFSRSTSSIML